MRFLSGWITVFSVMLVISIIPGLPGIPGAPGLPSSAAQDLSSIPDHETASGAGNEKPTGKVSTRLRYVPFEKFADLFERGPRGFLIPRGVFEEMKEAKDAFLARKPYSPVPTLPDDVIFGKAEYRGQLHGDAAEFEAVFHVEIPNDRWVVIPLPSGDVGFVSALLDEKPIGILHESFSGIQDSEAPKARVAQLQQMFSSARPLPRGMRQTTGNRRAQQNEFMLTVKAPGKHKLTVRFLVPKVDDPTKEELTFRIPRVPMNVFAVTLDEPGQFGEVDRSEGTVSQELENSGSTVSGVLGATDRFTLRWAPRTIPKSGPKPPSQPDTSPDQTPTPVSPSAPGESGTETHPIPPVVKIPPKIDAVSFSLFSIGEGYIRNESLIQLDITRAPQGQVSFLLPMGSELIDLRSDRLENFATTSDASGTRVLARLRSKVQGQVHFLLVSETKMASTSQVTVLPIHQVADAARDRGFIGIEPRTLVELRRMDPSEKDDAGLTVTTIDVSELPPEVANRALRPIILAFRYNTPPIITPLAIDIRRHEDAPVLTTAIDRVAVSTVLGNDENSVTCLDCAVKNNGRQYLEFRPAENSEIISADLDGNPVKPVLKSGGDSFLVPLSRQGAGTEEKNRVNLRLVYRSKIPPFAVQKQMKIGLATFSALIGRLDWRLFVPENYDVIPLRSQLNLTGRSPHSFFLEAIDDLIEGLMSPPFLAFLIFCGVAFLAYRFWKRSQETEFTWATVGKLLIGLVFVAVIFSSFSTFGERSFKFGSIANKLEMAPTSGGVPLPSVTTLPSSTGSRYSEEESFSDSAGDAPQELSLARPEAKRNYEVSKSQSSFGGKGDAQMKSGRTQPGSKVRSAGGRDRGALPVEMKIPATAKFVDFYRNVVQPNDKTEFRGFILWNPLYRLAEGVHTVIGLLFLVLVVLSAVNQMPRVAIILFSLFILGATFAEEALPGVQRELVAPFLLGLCLILILRAFWNVFRHIKNTQIATLLVFISLGFLPAWAGPEETPVNPRVEQIIDVYVPFSQLGERLPKDYPMVYLSQADFQYLKDLGIPEPDPGRWTPPYSCSFLSGNFDGIVTDERVELTVRVEADLLGKGFKYLIFPTDGVGIRSLTLDGEPVVFSHHAADFSPQKWSWGNSQNESPQMRMQQAQQMEQVQQVQQMLSPQQLNQNNIAGNFFPGGSKTAIVTAKEGRVIIEGLLVKDLFSKVDPSSKVRGFALALPPFGMGKLRLAVPEPQRQFEVNPSVKTEVEHQNGRSTVSAILQPASQLKVEWREKVEEKAAPVEGEPAPDPAPVQAKEPKVFVDHEVLYTVEEGIIRIVDLVKINVEQSPVGEFVFSIPENLEVRDVSGADLGERKFPEASGDRRLVIGLNARRMHRVEFKIELERETPGIQGEFPLQMPWLTEVSDKGIIERQKGYFGVEIPEGLEVSLSATSPAVQIDPRELPETIRTGIQGFLAHSFKFLAQPFPVMHVTKHRNVEVSTAQIDDGFARSLVTRDGKILTEYHLVVRNNNNQFLLLDNAASGPKLLSAMVNHEPVKPGLGPKGETYIPLIRSPRAAKSFQPFLVSLIFEDRTTPFRRFGHFDLALPAISLDISRLAWRIDVDEEYFLAKGPGPFQIDRKAPPGLPGQVQAGQGIARFSNVLTQASSNVSEDRRETAGAGSGLLPIMLEVPVTTNVMSFAKNIVISRDPAPSLQVYYGRKHILRFGQILLTLIIALLLAGFISALRQAGWGMAVLNGGLLLAGWGALVLSGDLFREITTFYPIIESSFHHGLKLGILLIIAGGVLSWQVALPKAKAIKPTPPPEE
jgi:hypothetical protein